MIARVDEQALQKQGRATCDGGVRPGSRHAGRMRRAVPGDRQRPLTRGRWVLRHVQRANVAVRNHVIVAPALNPG